MSTGPSRTSPAQAAGPILERHCDPNQFPPPHVECWADRSVPSLSGLLPSLHSLPQPVFPTIQLALENALSEPTVGIFVAVNERGTGLDINLKLAADSVPGTLLVNAEVTA